MFSGRVSQLFFSFTGTVGYSSWVGSVSSQAVGKGARASCTAARCFAGSQPCK